MTSDGWATGDGGVTYTKTGTYGTATLTTASGVVSYALDNNDTDSNALAGGASVSDDFTVFVKDGSTGTASTAVNFAITGTNDNPTVSAGAQSVPLVEAGVGTTGTANASIALTKGDFDTGDAASYDGAALTSDGWATGDGGATYTKTGTYGTATLTTASGVVSYALDNNDTDTNALAGGASVSDDFTVFVKDGSTGTASTAVNFAITGSNDNPTVSAGAQSVPLVEAGVGTTGTANASIALTKGDFDTGDAASYDGAALTGNGWATSDGGVTYTKTGTYGTATLTTATGVVSYALDNNDTDSNALAQGASVSDNFTVFVKDGSTGTASTAVNFAITGSNDNPTVTAGAQGVPLVEAGVGTTGTANASIALTKGDFDTGDAASYDGAALTSDGWATGDGGATYTKTGTYGTATLTTASGVVSYALDDGAGATNALAGGASVSDNFTVFVKDGSTGTASTAVNFAITGSNDNPTVSAGAQSVPLVEAGVGTGGTASATIALTKADPDTGDAAAYDATALTSDGWATGDGGATYTKTGTYGTATLTTASGVVSYALDNNDTDTNALAQGASVSDNFTAFVKDGSTGTASTAVNFAITGTNDAPDIHLVTTDTATATLSETNSGLSTSGTVTVNDPEVSDTVGSIVTTVVASGAIAGLGLTNAQLLAMMSVTPASNLAADPADTHNLTWTFNSGTQAFNYLNSGQSLVLTYTVQSTDNNAASDTQTITVTINGTNDAPTAVADTVLTSAGNNKSFDIPEWALVANDTDPDNTTLDVLSTPESVGSPSSGTVTHTAGTGSAGFVTFSDDSNAAGSFQYKATDGTSSGAAVTVTINNVGSSGNNITGTAADEILVGTDNKDNFHAGAGNDIIVGKAGGGTYAGDSGNDIIVYVKGANAGSGQVSIHGDNGAAPAGTDSDTLKIIQSTAATIDLSNASNQTNDSFTTVDGMENVDASLSSGAMTLTGSSGANILIGGSVADTISGGLGADTMTGGSGADTFIVNTSQSLATIGGSGNSGTITGFDVITDFDGAADFLDLQGTPTASTFSSTGSTDSTLTIAGATVKSHSITNGIVTFDTSSQTFTSAVSLDGTDTSRVAAAVQYLEANNLGGAGKTLAFTATINGVAHTYVYEQVGATPNSANDILVDLSNVTLTSGGTSLTTLITNTHVKPAGIAGESINLALTNPSGDPNTLITVNISGLPAGWSLNGGTNNGDGTWTVQTGDVQSLEITSSSTFTGALVLNITETWTGADGNPGVKFVFDNVEAYASGSPIFAISGDDNLTASSGHDLLVFSQPIGHDTVYSFDIATDQIDLIGYASMTSFADVQSNTTDDANGNAVITLGNGQTITLNGVHSADLTANDFVFDQTPTTNNPGTMTVGDGALLPLSGDINNTGTIELNSTGDKTDLQLIQHGITLQGGGTVLLSDSSGNVIEGTVSDVTLTNVDNTISGAGHLGNGLMTLINQGTIIATVTNALEIDTGSNFIANTGTLEATGTGGLVINSAVTNTGLLWANGGNIIANADVTGGSALISGSAKLELGAAASTDVKFDAVGDGILQLDHSISFSGLVSGFNAGDQFDLRDILFGAGVSASYTADESGTGGTLNVTDGVQTANISILGQYTSSDFELGTDGAGGTSIKYHAG
nr:VCBS domain-containing protein [Bradyrhizobium liaoningense]